MIKKPSSLNRGQTVITEIPEPQLNLFGETAQPPYPRRKAIKVEYIEQRAPIAPDKEGMGKLEKAFWTFHENNEQVYHMLVKFAREWRRLKSGSQLGISLLFERVRWEKSLETGDDEFKLNNNHRAFYARLIMKHNPDLDGVFRMRQQRIQSTIGPVNSQLPDGEHKG